MELRKYKAATVQAILEIIHRYRHPKEYVHLFFNSMFCPLCAIHKNYNICRGCPLANVAGSVGCINFISFKLAVYHHTKDDCNYYFNKRAEFFEKILPIVERRPFQYFTNMGWRYFAPIKRAW
jgi:hypothetical protein